MRSSTKYLLTAAGAATAAGAVVTAAALFPLGGASAGSAAGSAAPAEDLGECSGSYVKEVTLEEALPYLEAEGYTPADGSLDGFEFGYLPGFVAGEPFDTTWEAGVEGVGPDENRTWIPQDGLLLETWEEGPVDDPYSHSVQWDEAMSVFVTRSDHYTDIDGYFEAHEGAEPADHLGDGEIREFDSGEGLYTGTYAVWIPEPGVAVVVNLADPALDREPENEGEEPVPAGDPEEMLRVLEGITWE